MGIRRPFIASILITTAALVSQASAADPAITYIGKTVIPGLSEVKPDKSGLPHTLLEDGKSYQDSFDGFGSGLAYTGVGNRYVLLPDRGPNAFKYDGGESVDNTTSWKTRFHTVDITVTETGDHFDVNLSLKHSSPMVNEAGQNYVGLLTSPYRHDPEGIRVAPDGTVWVSDEYGPTIIQFDQLGHRIGALTVPANMLAKQAGNEAFELQSNQSGRVPNKGAEGLALTPDGHTLIAAMQAPLIQDGGKKGAFSRFMVYDLQDRTKAPKQLVYPLDAKHGISELLAINSHQFLVDERFGKGGPETQAKLYLIDLNQPGLTDVSNVEALPEKKLPEEIVALKKTEFANIAKLLNTAPNVFVNEHGFPEKTEGYAFGPDLPDGRHLLLAVNDNDFHDEFPNYVFAFAISKDALPDFQPVKLNDGVKFIGDEH